MSLDPPFLLIDRYAVIAEIGRGGQSIVYRAHDTLLKRDVAIKLLRDDALSEQMLARFRQEMEVTAQLEHAHILHVYDTGSYAGLPFIVMELAPGLTLTDRLERERQLPIADALQTIREIGLALAHAHDRGIVHRDVKPDNILLGASGALLADFGVARVTQHDFAHRITSTGMAVGTLLYMSPEQLCAEPHIDARADQYALACVLYEMLAGVRPHASSSFEGLRMLRMAGKHAPVRMHRPSVPPTVERAIEIALSPSSADRFRDMREFLQAVGADASGDFPVSDAGHRVHGDPSASVGTVAPPSTPVRAWTGRRGGVLLAAVAVIGALALTLPALRDVDTPAGPASATTDGDLVIALGTASGAAVPGPDSVPATLRSALRAELSAWQGLQVVDRASGGVAPSLFIEPAISVVNDSTRVVLTVRRTPKGRADRVERLVSQRETRLPAVLVHAMAIEALVHLSDSSVTPADVHGVERLPDRSFTALRWYVAGFSALRSGSFERAYALFDSTAKRMPRFAHAAFWAAQSGAWLAPNGPPGWRDHAKAAVRAGTLQSVDSLLAGALAAMGADDFPTACALYGKAVLADPTSFVARYGLGDCQRLDGIVQPVPSRPRFRSSHWSALSEYRRALELAPTGDWLGALLPAVMRTTYAEGSRARRGRLSPGGPTTHLALPSLHADTLAFVPLPSASFETDAVPESWVPAVRQGQSIARDITRRAVERWPSSPSIWLQRAIALELSGMVGPTPSGEDAGAALERASAGAMSERTRVEIAVARARIALRRGEFGAAARAARTAIAAPRSTDPAVRALLVPLALLVGDTRRAEALALPHPDNDPQVPVALADSIAAFALRAESGACEGLDEHRERLEAMFGAQFTRAELPAQRRRLLADPYLAAVPCLGTAMALQFDSPLLLHRVYRHLQAGQLPAARLLLDSLQQGRRGANRAAITWDAVYNEAWASARAGDTTGARAQIVGALENIASMSRFTLEQPAQAAGLRRGLELLVSLSDARAGDGARWSRMLRELNGTP